MNAVIPLSLGVSPTPPAPPVIPVIVTLPATPFTDTIRGGLLLTVGGVGLTSFDSDLTFLSTSDPAGMSASVTSGAAVVPTIRGLRMLTSGSAASAAYEETDTDYAYYDVSIDVEPLLPPTNALNSPIVIAYLEGRTTDGDIAYVRVVRDPRAADGFFQVEALATAAGDSVGSGGGLIPDTGTQQKIRLRLVRNGELLYAFAGLVDPVTDAMTDTVYVLETPYFTTVTGPIRFGVENLSEAVQVRTRFTSLRFRTAASVNGYLLNNIQTYGTRRIIGYVPPARLSIYDLGTHDFDVFSLWGRYRVVDGFEYVMPEDLTVGQVIIPDPRTLVTAIDPQLHNEPLS